MYEFKSGSLADTEFENELRETVKPEVIVTDFPVPVIPLSLDAYRRALTAEVLLRVLLAADIGAYGNCNNMIDAVRKVYDETCGEEKKGAESDAE